MLNATATTNNIDFTDYTNTPEIGLAAGIGIKFPLSGRSKFFIEYLGQGAIADIGKKKIGASIKNESGSLNIGINF